jgi:multimeric flavodoxin WrbA
MKAIAINGSPRKTKNTAQILEAALAGAASAGAETEMVHLYDLNFKGCISCFSCMKADGSGMWHCAQKDDLSPVLDRIMKSDVVFAGSPIYVGEVSGMTRCFLERLAFMNSSYDGEAGPKIVNNIRAAFFFTMNVKESVALGENFNYKPMFERTLRLLRGINGQKEYYPVYNTWQFDDYSKYMHKIFSVEEKREHHEKQFPIDLENAKKIGYKLAMDQ